MEAGLGPDGPGEWDGLGGFILGALVGSTVMTQVMAHAFGGSQGDLAQGLGATALATLGGVAAVAVMGGEGIVVLPLGQMWAAVATEHRTARSRGR